jgi:hypothetical protein
MISAARERRKDPAYLKPGAANIAVLFIDNVLDSVIKLVLVLNLLCQCQSTESTPNGNDFDFFLGVP